MSSGSRAITRYRYARKEDAAANGWHLVSDTSWAGYHELPIQIMAGYTVSQTIAQMGDDRQAMRCCPWVSADWLPA